MGLRYDYQIMFAQGKVVNLGCGEDPCNFRSRPDAVSVDMEIYNFPNFVQADLHKLPFKDKEFDTAILGDVLEHVMNPVQVMKEAGRVAKTVVMTVFEEWRLGDKPGKYVEKGMELTQKGMEDLGYTDRQAFAMSQPSIAPVLIQTFPDDPNNPHCGHIWQFDEALLLDLIEQAGLEINIFTKFPEGCHEGHTWYNWLVVAHAK